MAEKKQLVLVVEGTAALGPHWRAIVSDYLEKVIRKFCGNGTTEAASSIVELALVQFNAHGSYSACLVQRSGWARNVEYFLEWLSCMHFGGGGFCDAAIAEGLAEVLMMCPPNGTQTQPSEVLQRHCILVAASNPYPLPIPFYQPPNKSEMQSEIHLSDAEAVAKSFPMSCVSLSVICPKQLPKLKAIYNAGKRNPSATAPTIDVKNPQYLVLISEDFMEACAALSPSVVTNSPSIQSPSNMEVTSVSEPPPTSVSPVNESLLPQQPTVSVGNIPLATVKAEPGTVSLMASPQAAKTYSPSTSQELISNNDKLQDLKPIVSNLQQPLRPAGTVNVSILNSLSQARLASTSVLAGGTATGNSSIGGKVIHMSSMIAGSGSASLAGTAQMAQHAGTMMAAPGMSQQVQGMQSVGVSNMGTNVGLTQQTSSGQQSGRTKYLKIWEGDLRANRQSQTVLITRLEAYRSASTSESLAEDWPSTLLIDRLVSQDNMNNKQQHFVKCDLIVFRALDQHGFLGQMQDKKLCIVIRLPSQTLLLSVTDKPHRLIGMLFPGDMVVFKPHIPSQQLSQQQQRVGPGTSQGAVGPTQLVGLGQGQVSSPGQKPKPELP